MASNQASDSLGLLPALRLKKLLAGIKLAAADKRQQGAGPHHSLGLLPAFRLRELMIGMKMPPARAVVEGMAGAISASATARRRGGIG